MWGKVEDCGRFSHQPSPVIKTSFGKEDKLLFTGQYVHSIDEKGRLTVSKYFEAWPDCAPVYTYYEYDDTGFLLKSSWGQLSN